MKKIIENSLKDKQIIDLLENIDSYTKIENEEELFEIVSFLFKNEFYDKLVNFINQKISFFKKNFYEVRYLLARSYANLLKNDKAIQIAKEELSMPYIPLIYENKFASLLNELNNGTSEEKDILLTRNQIEQILLSSENKDLIIEAILELSKLNIRPLLDIIQTFFLSNTKNIYKLMLIDVLKNQSVNHDFLFLNKGKEYKINPITTPGVFESLSFGVISEKIKERFMSKEPNLYQIANETLFLYLSDIWPVQINNNLAEVTSISIIYYVEKMFTLIDEKSYFSKKQIVNYEEIKLVVESIENACAL